MTGVSILLRLAFDHRSWWGFPELRAAVQAGPGAVQVDWAYIIVAHSFGAPGSAFGGQPANWPTKDSVNLLGAGCATEAGTIEQT